MSNAEPGVLTSTMQEGGEQMLSTRHDRILSSKGWP